VRVNIYTQGGYLAWPLKNQQPRKLLQLRKLLQQKNVNPLRINDLKTICANKWFFFCIIQVMYESPEYQVVKKIDDFELRLYTTFHTVSIQESSLGGYSGFGYLFNYISGNNNKSTKMKMTVPVINDLNANEQSMEFVIPKIHEKDIPQPVDSKMKIKEYPSQHVLVYLFSGLINQDKLVSIMEKMKQILLTLKMSQVGTPKIARYNGPYSLPFLRHNEVWINVSYLDNAGKAHTT
jgi:hypothetical protein